VYPLTIPAVSAPFGPASAFRGVPHGVWQLLATSTPGPGARHRPVPVRLYGYLIAENSFWFSAVLLLAVIENCEVVSVLTTSTGYAAREQASLMIAGTAKTRAGGWNSNHLTKLSPDSHSAGLVFPA
jgi:hypothetical protein